MADVSEWLGSARIGVVGLGYVGLPLAVEFGRKYPVVGFDIRDERIAALREGHDETRETEPEDLRAAHLLSYSSALDDLRECNVFIVAVPTPIDKLKRPDLGPLRGACDTVGRVLKPGDTVVFESTVYPGCTEEECIPILERLSGLAFNRDFGVGYSPERINPGDRQHTLRDVVKVTSGSNPDAADRVDALYASIVEAGTYRADSIRVAEAAKVIENTQRDLNIALVNELAIIFNRMGIDTHAVLRAAASKWNFLPFRPGLVGGHCIGVDPYYLTFKAEAIGYRPEIILAGRRLNDRMGSYVAHQLLIAMGNRGIAPQGSRVLVMGLTFKEDCPDLRNTLVIDVIRDLASNGCMVDVHDPVAEPRLVQEEYGIELVADPPEGAYDAVVLAVAHDCFRQAGPASMRRLGRPRHVFYDVRQCFAAADSDLAL